MKRLFKVLFPPFSKWYDIDMFENQGTYKLIQMRFRINDNKKFFRIIKIGFINDFGRKPEIRERILTFKNEVDLVDLF